MSVKFIFSVDIELILQIKHYSKYFGNKIRSLPSKSMHTTKLKIQPRKLTTKGRPSKCMLGQAQGYGAEARMQMGKTGRTGF